MSIFTIHYIQLNNTYQELKCVKYISNITQDNSVFVDVIQLFKLTQQY